MSNPSTQNYVVSDIHPFWLSSSTYPFPVLMLLTNESCLIEHNSTVILAIAPKMTVLLKFSMETSVPHWAPASKDAWLEIDFGQKYESLFCGRLQLLVDSEKSNPFGFSLSLFPVLIPKTFSQVKASQPPRLRIMELRLSRCMYKELFENIRPN